jgi:hypothetical protein
MVLQLFCSNNLRYMQFYFLIIMAEFVNTVDEPFEVPQNGGTA